ncbi:metallophosphoesterase [Candidatus Pacearchaeota archaeon]|nr:metallophosphoesterase [Candidatus Pacearchaeota archaeon]
MKGTKRGLWYSVKSSTQDVHRLGVFVVVLGVLLAFIAIVLAAGDPPQIVINSPANNSNVVTFPTVVLNFTIGNSSNVWVYATDNASNLWTSLIYFNMSVGNATFAINWTAPLPTKTSNTVLLLHLDNQSGSGENQTLAYDFAGADNNATFTSSMVFNDSMPFGWGITLDGVASKRNASVADSGVFDMASYTVMAWIYMVGNGSTANTGNGGATGYPIITKGVAEAESSAADVHFFVAINSTNRVLLGDFENNSNGGAGLSQNAPVYGATPVTTNVWHHVVYVVQNWSYASVYLDGILDGNRSIAGSTPNIAGGTMKVGIGQSYNTAGLITGSFNGTIADIVIFNRSLSTSEIVNYYNHTLGIKYWAVNATNATGSMNFSGTFQFNLTTSAVNTNDTTPPAINFTSPTASNGSSQTATSIYVNVSSTDASTHYTFVDFDRTVKLWLRMDDINSTNGIIDSSSYSTNASNSSRAFQNASGKFNASFTFDGNSSIISLPSYPLLRNEGEGFTASLWLNRQPSASGTVYIFEMGALSFALTYEGSSIVCNLRNSTGNVYQTSTAFNPAVFDQFNGPPSDGMGIGCRTPSFCSAGNAWNGSLDEVIVFNRSLNNTEIGALYDATATQYTNNFTSLPAASHAFTAYAVDTSGNKNQTELRNVTITIASSDTTPPASNLNAPTNGTTVGSNATSFNATFTDDFQLANATFYIWNSTSLVNTTSIGFNGTSNASNITFVLPRGGTYFWNYLAYDNSSNSAFNATNFTLIFDTASPLVTINSPANQTYSSSPIIFNVSLSEAGLCQYSLNAGVTNYTMQSNSNVTFNASNSSIADGSYTARFYCNDTVNNFNRTASVTFALNTSIVFALSLNAPANASLITGNLSALLQWTPESLGSTVETFIYVNSNYSLMDDSLVYHGLRDTPNQMLSYNWSVPVTGRNESGLTVLLHMDNLSRFGENASIVMDYSLLNSVAQQNASCGTGCPVFNPTGRIAGALEFNATQNLFIANQGELSNTTEYTIMGWFNMTSNGTTANTGTGGAFLIPLVTKGMAEAELNSQDFPYFVGIRGDYKLTADYENITNSVNHLAIGSTTLNFSTWYHFAAKKNSSGLYIYLNGALEGSNLSATSAPTFSSTSRIGIGVAYLSTGTANGAFNGLLDEIAIYNTSLSDSQIMNHYNLSLQKYYWKVNISNSTTTLAKEREFTFFASTDTTPPAINLNAPTNGTTISSNATSFNATFSDNTQLANATFYIWNSTSLVNTTFRGFNGTNNATNITFVLPRFDTYYWNYQAYDNSSNSAFNATNFTVIFTTVDTNPPNVTINSPAQNATNQLTSTTLNVSVVDNSQGNITVRFFGRNITNGRIENFTFVLVPDTQFYAESFPLTFTNQTTWIRENTAALNIKFVISLGDVVQNTETESEWDRANASYNVLDQNNSPYIINVGNHDKLLGNYTNFRNYFGAPRYSFRSWWGNNQSINNSNSYMTMDNVAGEDLIFLSLEFCPWGETIVWANDTLKNYSNKLAVVTTHGFLDGSGNRNVGSAEGGCAGGTNTQYIWDGVINTNNNTFLVTSGHTPGEAHRNDTSLGGKMVWQLMHDYQGRTLGGQGWLNYMIIDPTTNRFNLYTINANNLSFETDADSQYSGSLGFDWAGGDNGTYYEIGNISVANGTSASVVWSSLVPNGTYEWYASATDSDGQQTNSSVYNFTVMAILNDSTVPVVNLNAPANGSTVSSNSTSFNATFSDDYQLRNATFYIWNSTSLVNTTFRGFNGTSNASNITFVLPRTDIYYWNYLAYDNSSNSAFNRTNFTLIFAVSDTSVPSVNLNAPANGSTVLTNATSFNATFTDDYQLRNATFYIWNATTLVNTTFRGINGTSNASNITFVLPRIDTYYWNYQVYDNSSNGAFNSSNFTVIFSVADITAPSVNLNAPSNGTTVTTNSTSFNASFSDDYQLSNATFFIWNATSLVNTTFRGINGTNNATNITFVLPRFDTYFWNYKVFDNSSNGAFNATNFTLIFAAADTTAPVANLLAPPNNTIVTSSTVFFAANFTDNSQLANATLVLYNSTGSLISTNITTVTGTSNSSNLSLILSAQGRWFWNYQIVDSSSNRAYNSSNYTITLDSVIPGVTINIPANITYNNASFNFNVSLNEQGTVLFSLNGGATNYTMGSTNNQSFNYTNSSIRDGSYTFKVYANDSAGNRNDTTSVVFSIDTTVPAVTIDVPQNTTYTSSSFTFNVTLNENGTVLYTLNAGLTNYSMSSSDGLHFNASNSSIGQGSFTFKVWVNDSVGNRNDTTQTTFFVDSLTPGIEYVSPTDTNGSSSTRRFILINVTGNDTNLANITISLFNTTSLVNRTLKTLSPNFVNISVAADGIYYFNATIVDTVGNVNSTNTRTFIIDTAAPLINLTAPDNGKNYSGGQAISFQYTVSDIIIQNCSLTVNSTVIDSSSSISTSATNTFTDSLGVGFYTWNISCLDSVLNSNISATRVFNITASSSGSGSSGSSGSGSGAGAGAAVSSPVTYIANTSDLSDGYNQSLRINDRINFSRGLVNHTVIVNDIKESTVNVTIFSSPINLILHEGDRVKLNFTSPDYYDIMVEVLDIIASRAVIKVQEIPHDLIPHEAAPEPEVEPTINISVSHPRLIPDISEHSILVWTSFVVIALMILTSVRLFYERRAWMHGRYIKHHILYRPKDFYIKRD